MLVVLSRIKTNGLISRHLTGITTTKLLLLPRSACMARYMPSGMQLPSCWNTEMDAFICNCDATGDCNLRTIIKGLKRRFKELETVLLSTEAIERRIFCLDQQENEYFVEGMMTAVEKAEKMGFALPPMNFEKYARRGSEDNEVSSDVRYVYRNHNHTEPALQTPTSFRSSQMTLVSPIGTGSGTAETTLVWL